jgi:hypothetical protein
MIRKVTLGLAVIALAQLPAVGLRAQTAPPTYEGDPSVYKIIYEDQNLRLIEAHWKAGQTDKPHSHPASVAYAVQDCTVRLHLPDGTTRDISPKAGTAMAVAVTPSHTAENLGTADCRALFIEHK